MSNKYPGGLVTLNPPVQNPALGAATNGVWTMDQALNAETNRSWAMYDPYYNNVVLNLHGNGTNGAQNNTFLDSSSNNFTITRNGNTTQGAFNPYQQNGYWSNYFDGSSNIVGSLSSALGTGDFTVEFWVYIVSNTGASGEGGFFQTTSSSTGLSTSEYGVSSLTMQRNSGTNTYGFAVGGTSVPFSNSGTYLNQWMHIACVRSSGTVRIYMNGVLNSTPTTATTNLTGTYIGIGGYYNGSYLCNAYITNFRATSTVVYSGNFTPPTTPLTAITGTLFLGCQSNRFLNTSSGAAMTVNTGSPKAQTFQPFLQNLPYESSRLGGSGYFDGSGDQLTVATNAAFTFGTGDFTVEGWVYVLTSGNDGIFQQGTSYFPSSTGNTVAVGINSDNTWQIYAKNTNTNSTATFALNSWNHFALVRSGTTTTLYANGVSVITVSADSTDYTGTYFGIGSIYGGGTADINAYISNLRVVKGTAVYTGAFAPPLLAPLATSGAASVACYSSTTNVNTSFASSACSLLLSTTNAGIFDNAIMNNLETVGNAQVSTTQKKYGTASIYFDGTGDYLKSPSNPVLALGSGDFTIEFWAYLPAYSGNRVLSWGTTSAPIIYFASGYLYYDAYGGSNIAQSTIQVATTTWAHCAVVRASGTTKIYINGALGGSATDANNWTGQNGIWVGTDAGTTFFTGYLDDIRITKGVARYLGAFTPPTSQLQDQ